MREYFNNLQDKEILQRLQQGEHAFEVSGKEEIYYKYGVFVKYLLGTDIRILNTPIMTGVDTWYFEKFEPIKLEVGKIYETRVGEQVRVEEEIHVSNLYSYIISVIGCDNKNYCVTKDGRYDPNCSSEYDLVKVIDK